MKKTALRKSITHSIVLTSEKRSGIQDIIHLSIGIEIHKVPSKKIFSVLFYLDFSMLLSATLFINSNSKHYNFMLHAIKYKEELVMLLKCILLTLVARISSVDEQLFGATLMGCPLVLGTFVGLILGDLSTGLILSATLEAMFMGSIMIRNAAPPEVCTSSMLDYSQFGLPCLSTT